MWRAVRSISLLVAACHVSFCFAAESILAPPRFAPDRILIKPKASLPDSALEDFHQEQGAHLIRTFRTGAQVIGFSPAEKVPDVVDRYKKSGLVEYAEPDYIVRAAAAPDDPLFLAGIQWSLVNTGQNDGIPGADIHALQGWEFQNSASNIVVAILDTGLLYTHEDLVSNLWVNTNDNTHGFNAFTESHFPLDDQGHGTQVAGILGATGNNGIGLTGVAWRLQMMSCKCLNDMGEGTDSSVIAALEFAQTNGARIINASFSGPDFSESVSNALAMIRATGIIVVAPVGNNWSDVDVVPRYPACYDLDNIVSVGFTDNEDYPGFNSNFGVTNVDLMAPGAPLFSTCYEADNAYGPTNYPAESLSGTSYAAAHVSGALALILERFPAEHYTTSLRRLMLSVDRLPQLEGKCATSGRLNLAYAFNPPIQLTLLSATENSIELRVESAPNRTYVIESSPDLALWAPVYTNATSLFGSFNFVDSGVTNSPQRFYRATPAP